ncbi:hypothetical protein [Bifidobacterium primatium]|uniref:hypothetical protein n=1 Tax=Bifidobacterium primatium TaxID=2045438 RepID=UPI00105665D5|nr:hypothetical protein [Bifidobacterium primatium]
MVGIACVAPSSGVDAGGVGTAGAVAAGAVVAVCGVDSVCETPNMVNGGISCAAASTGLSEGMPSEEAPSETGFVEESGSLNSARGSNAAVSSSGAGDVAGGAGTVDVGATGVAGATAEVAVVDGVGESGSSNSASGSKAAVSSRAAGAGVDAGIAGIAGVAGAAAGVPAEAATAGVAAVGAGTGVGADGTAPAAVTIAGASCTGGMDPVCETTVISAGDWGMSRSSRPPSTLAELPPAALPSASSRGNRYPQVMQNCVPNPRKAPHFGQNFSGFASLSGMIRMIPSLRLRSTFRIGGSAVHTAAARFAVSAREHFRNEAYCNRTMNTRPTAGNLHTPHNCGA